MAALHLVQSARKSDRKANIAGRERRERRERGLQACEGAK